jgi:hypothetical protein
VSEIEKMREFIESGESEILSSFWDWLESHGFRLSRWEQLEEEVDCPKCMNGIVIVRNPDPLIGWSTADIPEMIEEPCSRCEGAGYLVKPLPEREIPWTGGPEKLFAEYAGIDLYALDRERRDILDSIRRLNEESA